MTARSVAFGSTTTALVLVAIACKQSVPTESTASVAEGPADRRADRKELPFTKDYRLQDCEFQTVGRNPFFPLVPGRTQDLEGKVNGTTEHLEITVLSQTLAVGGIQTRIVEERHTENGQLIEVSRNYFAHCVQNGSVFYFGEDVDIYENGRIVAHTGAWRHGVNGAQAGVFMPGIPLLGSRYYQEVAPAAALDRAEIIQLDAVVETPYGRFREVLVTEESTPFEPGVLEYKRYAPGVGLVVDGTQRLVAVRGPSGP